MELFLKKLVHCHFCGLNYPYVSLKLNKQTNKQTKQTEKLLNPILQNVLLFGNRVVKNLTDEIVMQSCWSMVSV